MYNTKYKCRYYDFDFSKDDYIDNDEKDFIKNILYREDLMNIFNVDDADDFSIFDNIFTELYEKIKNYQPLEECLKKAAHFLLSENPEIGLCIFYSYDFMFITHICISEYLETGKISDENINVLKKCVNNS